MSSVASNLLIISELVCFADVLLNFLTILQPKKKSLGRGVILKVARSRAFHDEDQVAVQGNAEIRTWLKWWDPSLEASWHLCLWKCSRLGVQPWAL